MKLTFEVTKPIATETISVELQLPYYCKRKQSSDIFYCILSEDKILEVYNFTSTNGLITLNGSVKNVIESIDLFEISKEEFDQAYTLVMNLFNNSLTNG